MYENTSAYVIKQMKKAEGRVQRRERRHKKAHFFETSDMRKNIFIYFLITTQWHLCADFPKCLLRNANQDKENPYS